MISPLLERIRYRLLWIEYKWADQVGRMSDGSYRFFFLFLVPARNRHIHDVMRALETFLVWQVGSYYLAMT